MFSILPFLISLAWNAINFKKIALTSISFANIIKEELQNQEDVETVSISIVRNLDKDNDFIYRDNFVQFLRGATLYYVELTKKNYCLGIFYLSPRDESAAYIVKKLICACDFASTTDVFDK